MTALNQLNRNIENTTAVGSSFEIPSRLWSQFEAVMASTAPSMVRSFDAPAASLLDTRLTLAAAFTAQEEQVLAQQREPEEALRNLPAGVAPGGGTHDYH